MNDGRERALPHDPDLEVDEDAVGQPRSAHLSPLLLALVFAGGFVGVLLRASLDRLHPGGTGFPVTTFGINVAGALALAILVETLALRGRDVGQRRSLRLILGTGLLGGFTTYSALAFQTDALLRAGEISTALAYAVGTVVLGFIASLAGIVLTRRALAR